MVSDPGSRESARPRVGLLLIDGTIRHVTDDLAQPLARELEARGIEIRSIALAVPDLMAADPASKARGTRLGRTIRDAAHLPTRRSLLMADVQTLPWKISGAILDGFWIVAASLIPLSYLFSNSRSNWIFTWLLLTQVLAAGLAIVAVVTRGSDVPAASLRRTGLLILWPLVLVLAAPLWMLGIGGLIWLTGVLGRRLQDWWPMATRFEGDLPLSEPVLGWLMPLVGVGAVSLVVLTLGWVLRRWDGAVAWPSRLVRDLARYLGDRLQRRRAQARLHDALEAWRARSTPSSSARTALAASSRSIRSATTEYRRASRNRVPERLSS